MIHIIPIIYKITKTMKTILASKRSKAIIGIGIIAVSIGAISKIIINYPAGSCMKGSQQMTFNK